MKAMDRCHHALRHLAVALAALFAGAALAQTPAKPIVSDVIVPPGNYQIPIPRIYALIQTRAGSAYDPVTIDDDVRRLYETHAFTNVQVKKTDPDADGRVTVYFLLTPQTSIVQEIIYEGAKHLSNDDLALATGLHRGQSLNPIGNRSACRAIEKKYEEKARMFAQVDLLEGGTHGDTRVHFQITEGPKVKVRGTRFTGNHFISESQLRAQIHLAHAFLPLLEGAYSPGLADRDGVIIEQYYKSFGFDDVAIARELQWSEDHRSADICFHINEGPRYRLVYVDATSRRVLDQDKLLALIPVKPDDFYNAAVIQAGETNIKDAIGYEGREVLVHIDPFSPNAAPSPDAVPCPIFIFGNGTAGQDAIRRQVCPLCTNSD
jgi:outer membrane protein assembly factor BamA